MSPVRPPRFRTLLHLALVLLLAPLAPAIVKTNHPAIDPHHVVPTSLFQPLDLTGNWLVHTGDDPSFASPALDDSHWLVVTTSRPLSSFGITQPSFVWYRTHVHLPPGSHHLGLFLRGFRGSEQIFVNGILVGPNSRFPPGGLTFDYDQLSPIPDSLLASGDLTIALRASVERLARSRNDFGLGPYSDLLLGDTGALTQTADLFQFRDFTSNVTILSLELVLLVITIALAFALSDNREYLALVAFLSGNIGMGVIQLWWPLTLHDPGIWSTFLHRLFQAILVLGFIEFARIILRLRRGRVIIAYEWIVFVFFLFLLATDQLPLRAVRFQAPGYTILVSVLFVLTSIPTYFLLPPFALWIGWKQRNTDALLFSLPLFLQSADIYTQIFSFFLFRLGLIANVDHSNIPIATINTNWTEVSDLLFYLALLVFLILRTIRIARARAQASAELEAAHTTQQLLLARASQPTPGFTVETVYLPAREVGGDFFLVSPAPGGALTAIVGDVSGKGLTAALRVSLILGVLRRESSRDPATILANLNFALLTQGELGFTTACCVHLTPAGALSVANAGHLSPYLAGSGSTHELSTPPALPLGLAPGQIYETVSSQLLPGQRLVLLSDGVPEARSHRGELYGFDRLLHLLHLPAAGIAATAQTFGQEDDITVLTLACTV